MRSKPRYHDLLRRAGLEPGSLGTRIGWACAPVLARPGVAWYPAEASPLLGLIVCVAGAQQYTRGDRPRMVVEGFNKAEVVER